MFRHFHTVNIRVRIGLIMLNRPWWCSISLSHSRQRSRFLVQLTAVISTASTDSCNVYSTAVLWPTSSFPSCSWNILILYLELPSLVLVQSRYWGNLCRWCCKPLSSASALSFVWWCTREAFAPAALEALQNRIIRGFLAMLVLLMSTWSWKLLTRTITLPYFTAQSFGNANSEDSASRPLVFSSDGSCFGIFRKCLAESLVFETTFCNRTRLVKECKR